MEAIAGAAEQKKQGLLNQIAKLKVEWDAVKAKFAKAQESTRSSPAPNSTSHHTPSPAAEPTVSDPAYSHSQQDSLFTHSDDLPPLPPMNTAHWFGGQPFWVNPDGILVLAPTKFKHLQGKPWVPPATPCRSLPRNTTCVAPALAQVSQPSKGWSKWKTGLTCAAAAAAIGTIAAWWMLS
jgi:hypothetical protein